MLKIKEWVKASSIWEKDVDYEDKGKVNGLVRGYCFEVVTEKGNTTWSDTTYIYNEPETYINSGFTQSYYEDMGWTFTGRATFRGYGREVYDLEEHETFIEDVLLEEVSCNE